LVYYSYIEFIKDLKELIKVVNFDFNCILAVSRGGLTIGHFLSNHYELKNIHIVNTSYYNNQTKLDRVSVSNIPDLSNFTKVLIVDEIVDSGESAKELMRVLNDRYPTIEFKFLSIFKKDTAVFQPDFFVKKATDWIEFFWEVDTKR
jgi:xanthine phosphoribosyltransferase